MSSSSEDVIRRILSLGLEQSLLCSLLAHHAHPDVTTLCRAIPQDTVLAGSLRHWISNHTTTTSSSSSKLQQQTITPVTPATPQQPTYVKTPNTKHDSPRKHHRTGTIEDEISLLRAKHISSVQRTYAMRKSDRSVSSDSSGYFDVRVSKCSTFSTSRRFASPSGWAKGQYMFDEGPSQGFRSRTECRPVSAGWNLKTDSPGPGAYSPRFFQASTGSPRRRKENTTGSLE
eukprot:PhF_6_TR4321/c0_g1_i2/m.5826